MTKVKALDFDTCTIIINNRLYKVSKDGKFGVITLDGEVYAPAVYDDVVPIRRGDIVCKQGKVPNPYDKNEIVLIKLIRDGKLGLIDPKGNVCLNAEWNPEDVEIRGLCNADYDAKLNYNARIVGFDYVVVGTPGKKGAYTFYGRPLVPHIYTDIEDNAMSYHKYGTGYSLSINLIAKRENKLLDLYNTEGQIMIANCDFLGQFRCGCFYYKMAENPQYGVFSHNKYSLPCKYDVVFTSYYCLIVKDENFHYVVLPDGKIAFSSPYSIKDVDLCELIFQTYDDNGFPIFVDVNGKML